MKTPKIFLSLSLTLLIGVVSCNEKKSQNKYANPEELERIHQFFNTLNSGYNFTLESINEGNVRRSLFVYDRYCFYYNFINYSSRGEHGMFYIEGQSVQDFHISNSEVVIDFHEGPGKVEVVENFAHDDYGYEFANIPISELLNVNWKNFYKVDDNEYYTQDRKINRVFCYYTNEYLCNWNDEYYDEEHYVDFSKSKSTLIFNPDGSATVFFEPYYKSNVGFESDGSILNIYNVGTTADEIIFNYREHPNPITKKANYGFNSDRYEITFGDAEIPFSEKFSGYISMIEDYNNAAITIYDMCYEDGIVADIVSNLGDDWALNEEDSAYWTSQKHHEVKTYVSESTITEFVQGQYIDNTVEVYLSFGVSPVSLEPTQVDKTLRPRGFFVMEIYRKLGEEAITDVNDITTYLETNVGSEYLFDLSRLRAYQYLVMRDYTENLTIKAAFESQGIYLFSYIELRIENLAENRVISFANGCKNDLLENDCYSTVTLDNNYNLSTEPDLEYFAGSENPLIQVMGAPIKDNANKITGYQIIIMCYGLN